MYICIQVYTLVNRAYIDMLPFVDGVRKPALDFEELEE